MLSGPGVRRLASALPGGQAKFTLPGGVFGSGSSGYNGHYAMLEFNPAWKDSINFISFQDGLTDTYEEKGEWTERLAAFEAQPAGAGITSSKPTR